MESRSQDLLSTTIESGHMPLIKLKDVSQQAPLSVWTKPHRVVLQSPELLWRAGAVYSLSFERDSGRM